MAYDPMRFDDEGTVLPDGYDVNSVVPMTAAEREAIDLRIRNLFPDLTCDACGYVSHDVPTTGDNGHENLCCGSGGACYWLANPGELCITHEPVYEWTEFENSEARRKMNQRIVIAIGIIAIALMLFLFLIPAKAFGVTS